MSEPNYSPEHIKGFETPLAAYQHIINSGHEIVGINESYPKPFCEQNKCRIHYGFIKSPKDSRGTAPDCSNCEFSGEHFSNWLIKRKLPIKPKSKPKS